MADIVTVHVKGLDQLLRGLEVAPELLETEARQAMQKSVDLSRGLIASRVDLGPGRDGHLCDLITSRVIGPPIKGLVEADKYTAPWVEFGTKPHIIKINRLAQSMYGPYQQVIHHP